MVDGTTMTSVPAYGYSSTHMDRPTPKYTLDQIINAVYGQESNYGKNTKTSPAGAIGPMQITPATGAAYSVSGEDLNNPQHNMTIGRRILSDYYTRYNGDPGKIFTAYYSGPGNVNTDDGAKTPYIKNSSYGNTSVQNYIDQATPRLDGAVAPEVAGTGAAPAATTPPSVASLIGQGDWAGAAKAFANDPSLMGSLSKMGEKPSGGGGGVQAPSIPGPPKLETNVQGIAQQAPQLMAQLLASQQQLPMLQRRPPGLSLGGYSG